mgnify:CR=1 FL=1
MTGSAYAIDTAKNNLPEVPGETCLAHAATQWVESAEALLAGLHLLAAAQGLDPPGAACIVDVDLAGLVPLPPDHREYHRREERRILVQTQNEANERKRHSLRMEARTTIYALLKNRVAFSQLVHRGLLGAYRGLKAPRMPTSCSHAWL